MACREGGCPESRARLRKAEAGGHAQEERALAPRRQQRVPQQQRGRHALAGAGLRPEQPDHGLRPDPSALRRLEQRAAAAAVPAGDPDLFPLRPEGPVTNPTSITKTLTQQRNPDP